MFTESSKLKLIHYQPTLLITARHVYRIIQTHTLSANLTYHSQTCLQNHPNSYTISQPYLSQPDMFTESSKIIHYQPTLLITARHVYRIIQTHTLSANLTESSIIHYQPTLLITARHVYRIIQTHTLSANLNYHSQTCLQNHLNSYTISQP